jgi:hypothetical protein
MHLRCDYFDNKDGILCYFPIKYISKMTSDFDSEFGCQEYKSPL